MKKTPVKAHTRRHPTKNKKVEVGSYSRNQRYRQYKNLTKGSRIPELKCFYCGDTVSLGEAIQSDKKLGKMEGEDREFLLDSLPKSNNPRKVPFVHKSDFGYDVLNICSKHIKGINTDDDVDQLINQRESIYKNLKWIDNKIALRERQIRKIGNKYPLKAETFEEDIRELTEDQEVLGERLGEIEKEIEANTGDEFY